MPVFLQAVFFCGDGHLLVQGVMMDSLRKDFQSPPHTFRGAPFWSWNDHLQVEELARQARDMQAHGMGGFFMHARDGLETPYMGEKWLESIRETVKTAHAIGVDAWLYDEDRWPSGFAGGLVPARGGDAFRSKGVVLEMGGETAYPTAQVLAAFAGRMAGDKLETVRRLDTPDAPLATSEVRLAFRRVVDQPSEWFNDDAYADNLNPDSVKAFIDITYEAYAAQVGEEFGKAVPGIFTDEPNIQSHQGEFDDRSLPWTDGLPDFFRERRGYDLLDVLPWLFFDGPAAAKARHDYWYTISQRFSEAYSKQLGEWCQEHQLAFTGHFLNESEMGQGILRGGAIMPHYRYQQVPGIDMLTEQNHEFITIKQCSSVANQFGRARVLSETYGCSGWEFTFEGQKWNGDWQYVLGVNLRCQHLALYSLRGCRKRDFPPSFNYNTTWWKYNGVVEDYFARVGRVLSEGNAVRDVLVLHPVATGWSMLGEGEASVAQVDAFGETINQFSQVVLATHYDFDFGDEQIMAADGRVEDECLWVGRAPYGVVVIPPGTRTLLASTVALLERFLAAGGKVIGFSPLPDWVEAQPSDRLPNLWALPGVITLCEPAELNDVLEAILPRHLSLVDLYGQQAARLLCMQRDLGDRQAFFVVNNDRAAGCEVQVSLRATGSLRVEEWNPLNGQTHTLEARLEGSFLRFSTYFGPAGSRLYVVGGEASAEAATGRPFEQMETLPSSRDEPVQYLGPVCAFQRSDPNVLTLDTCQYRLADGEWSAEMEVWRAQNELRQRLGMRPNYYNGLPQRYRWALKAHPADGAPAELRFTFPVQQPPSGPVFWLVESAERFKLRFNGQAVQSTVAGWYLDRAFDRVALPPLRAGLNECVLSCAYSNYMELEDCYLLGDFGVSLAREIIAEPQQLHFGDWTAQGYPHYAGSMRYQGAFSHQDGKRCRIFLSETRAVDVALWINGKLAGHIPWRSVNGLDVSALCQAGENRLEVEVVASPRNMLGPLHRAPEHEEWTDWQAFRRTDESYTPGYVLWPWGLFGQVRIVED
jgi:hypothetical protein